MKKILLSILICGSILAVKAQEVTPPPTTTTTTTTTTTHKYFYYPESNVYFDETTGTYWYQDKGATTWTTTQTLPSTITAEKTQQVPIIYSGNDPWKNNTADIKKYKVKKSGKTKIKTEDKD